MQLYRPRSHHTQPRTLSAAPPTSATSTEVQRWRNGSESYTTTIEQLPRTILSHILSFAPAETAVQTTVLSPAWHDVWLTSPVMDFNMFSFHRRVPNEPVWKVRQIFSRFVTNAMNRRPSTNRLKKLRLYFCYGPIGSESDRVMVYSWLTKAISSKVVELDLDFESQNTYKRPRSHFLSGDDYGLEIRRERMEDLFDFYFSLLINSSVEIVKLRDCDFTVPKFGMNSIKELHLQNFSSTDEDVESMIPVFANLEVLTIVDGKNLVHLKIVSKKLRIFRLDGFNPFREGDYTVQICAPKLESVGLAYVFASKFELTDSPLLMEANVEFPWRSWWEFVCWTSLLGALRGVQRLTLQNMWPWTLSDLKYEAAANVQDIQKRRPKGGGYVAREFMRREYHVKLQRGVEALSDTFAFQNLKHLELVTGYSRDDILGLEVMLKKSPQLETLILVHEYASPLKDTWKGLTYSSLDLQIPHLKLVKMMKFKRTKKELFLMNLLKKHGKVLKNILTE